MKLEILTVIVTALSGILAAETFEYQVVANSTHKYQLKCSADAQTLKDAQLVRWYHHAGDNKVPIFQITLTSADPVANSMLAPHLSGSGLQTDAFGSLYVVAQSVSLAGEYSCGVETPSEKVVSTTTLHVQAFKVDVLLDARFEHLSNRTLTCQYGPDPSNNASDVELLRWFLVSGDGSRHPLFVVGPDGFVYPQTSKDEKVKDLLSRANATKDTLTVMGVKVWDEGRYECSVSYKNYISKGFLDAYVFVDAPAAGYEVLIAQIPRDLRDAKPVALECVVPQAGRPWGTLEWIEIPTSDDFVATPSNWTVVDKETGSVGLLAQLVISRYDEGWEHTFKCQHTSPSGVREVAETNVQFKAWNKAGAVLGIIVCILVGLGAIVVAVIIRRVLEPRRDKSVYGDDAVAEGTSYLRTNTFSVSSDL